MPFIFAIILIFGNANADLPLPKPGDYAEFEQYMTYQGELLHTWESRKVLKCKKDYSSCSVEAGYKKEGGEWSFREVELTLTVYRYQFYARCSENGGVIKDVEIPLGKFSSCFVADPNDPSKRFDYYGPVPFGDLWFYRKTTDLEVERKLIKYSFAQKAADRQNHK